MPDFGFHIKLFTLVEANGLLPRIRELLVSLRESRRKIMGLQAKVDIEEITASELDTKAMDGLLSDLGSEMEAFHGSLAELQGLGCELKDLDRGLVDFYSVRGNDVVYLCWMDGESGIGWWHPLDTGLKGRAPL